MTGVVRPKPSDWYRCCAPVLSSRTSRVIREQPCPAAEVIDYVESKSLQGVSIITARLKLNVDSTKALADISSKVDQVRNELPIEAEVPAISTSWGGSS